MRIITVSRQFGSGGREIARRIADILGYEYYDKEIFTILAQNAGMDSNYVEKVLTKGSTRGIPITFGRSIAMAAYSPKTDLLINQNEILKKIAASGRDCVIVGRCANVVLKEHNPFNLFVCADIEARIDRCMEREKERVDMTRRDFERNIHAIDKERRRTYELMGAGEWGNPAEYSMVINSTGRDIKKLSAQIARFAEEWFNG